MSCVKTELVTHIAFVVESEGARVAVVDQKYLSCPVYWLAVLQPSRCGAQTRVNSLLTIVVPLACFWSLPVLVCFGLWCAL